MRRRDLAQRSLAFVIHFLEFDAVVVGRETIFIFEGMRRQGARANGPRELGGFEFSLHLNRLAVVRSFDAFGLRLEEKESGGPEGFAQGLFLIGRDGHFDEAQIVGFEENFVGFLRGDDQIHGGGPTPRSYLDGGQRLDGVFAEDHGAVLAGALKWDFRAMVPPERLRFVLKKNGEPLVVVFAIHGVGRGVHVENANFAVLVQNDVILGVGGDRVEGVWPGPAAGG